MEQVIDKDYGELTVKAVKHKLWPVSYIDDEGKQVDALYSFNPSRVDKSYWIGEAFTVETLHPIKMDADYKQAKIDALKAQIAKLEAGDE